MEKRKQEEKQFHNMLRKDSLEQRWSPELEKSIEGNPLWANMKYYSIERKSRRVVLDWLADNCKGKRVLDYCCGNGDDSVIIAKNGARETVGIDISEVSIKNCVERALTESVSENTSFYVMDAEALKFDNDSFDIIAEYGALHHVSLEKAYSELARVLKPDGKCIIAEVLGHNPIIHYYRKKTPSLRTEWEVANIFRKKNIEMAKDYFSEVKIIGFFHLATLGAVPFRNLKAFNAILGSLEALDSVLLKLPVLKWQAWQVIFELSKPKRTQIKEG